ncbi:Hypothetical predicted protein [Cloeon dipterum]|uniref:Uncharacterized protein n=1 Tax=Cloeon dipterum TaxID=197152 RepID=A0A8S1C4V7_9INSE|nr:Hypothetical predicted protein [Cloeon dipterum]
MSELEQNEVLESLADQFLEARTRCAQLCRQYLHAAQVEFRGSVDKAKQEMRELWDVRAPKKGKKGKKGKKK